MGGGGGGRRFGLGSLLTLSADSNFIVFSLKYLKILKIAVKTVFIKGGSLFTNTEAKIISRLLTPAYVICGKVMFSVMNVCLRRGGEPYVTTTPGSFQPCSPGTLLSIHTSIGKRAVGLRNKDFLFFFKVNTTKNCSSTSDN